MRIDCQSHVFPTEYAEVLTRNPMPPQATPQDGGYVITYGDVQSFRLRQEVYSIDKKISDMDSAGIDVSIKEWEPGVIPVEAVLTGKSHFGVSGAGSTVLLHRLRGKPVVVLAVIFQHSPIILLTKKGSGILSPQEIVGRKIVMGAMELNAELYAMLIKEGVAVEKLDIGKPGRNLERLIAGEADIVGAYITNAPDFLQERGVLFHVIRPLAYGESPDFLRTESNFYDHMLAALELVGSRGEIADSGILETRVDRY